MVNPVLNVTVIPREEDMEEAFRKLREHFSDADILTAFANVMDEDEAEDED